ncbi:MAG: DUF1538 domain-containing protein, partial [Alistipes onderdonkii]|nr:DUF1538 domain-containing protein [Alistipes onderdonkii]
MQRPRKRMLSAIDPEPSMARMNAVRWLRVMLCVYMLRLFKSPDGVVVVAYFPFVVAVEAVADRHVERAVAVAVGVGMFFVLALLRTIFKIRLSLLLILFYIAVFVLSAFVPNEFVSVAFDSGGVTTGPITVPFIMALGVGLASIRGDSGAQDDSFGLVALCSIGPVLAVLLLGIFYSGGDAGYTQITVPNLEDTRQVASEFVHALPDYIREVVSALLPVIVFCALFQLIFRRFHKAQLTKIGIGFLYTFIGLALFLTGVNVGFMPAGHYLGQQLALSGRSWLLIPLGMLIGYFLVTAEPAV